MKYLSYLGLIFTGISIMLYFSLIGAVIISLSVIVVQLTYYIYLKDLEIESLKEWVETYISLRSE